MNDRPDRDGRFEYKSLTREEERFIWCVRVAELLEAMIICMGNNALTRDAETLLNKWKELTSSKGI